MTPSPLPSNPRVLLIAADFPPDVNGIGDYVGRLAGHLAARGGRVSVLTRTVEDDGVERPFDVHRLIGDWSLSRLDWLADFCRDFDVVHLQYPGVASGRSMLLHCLPMALRRRTGGWGGRVRSVATFHEFRSMRTRWRVRASVMLRGLDRAVVVDAQDAPPIRRWSRLYRPLAGPPPIEAVPIAPNIQVLPRTEADRQRWRNEIGLAADETAVAFFGIIYEHKGIGELLRAVERLRRDGRRVRPVVVGNFDRDAEWRSALETLLGRPHVIWQSDADSRRVSELLHACDLAALPYYSGSAPNRSALLTCLAHDLATVTTDGPTTPRDFVEDCRIGYVPPRDADALADALAGLCDDPARRRELAAVGRAYAGRYAWPAVAEQHAALYAALAGPPDK